MDLVAGMWQLLSTQLGAVPHALWLTEPVTGFVGTLATKIVQLKPFRVPADFNRQLREWLPVANSCTVRRLDARPFDVVAVDVAAILALPPVPPQVSTVNRIRLPRDGHRLARHDRVWAHGLTLTDPDHVETAARLRSQFQQPAPAVDTTHPVRDLADYDRALGVDFDGAIPTLDGEVVA